MRCARARRVQPETAEETEAIEHLPTSGEFGHAPIIYLLIQVEAGLVTRQ